MTDKNLSWLYRVWYNIVHLTNNKNRNNRRSKKIRRRNEFIVIGLGRFGTSLAMTLSAYNHDVLAIDIDIKRVQQVTQVLPHVIQLDATKLEALSEIGAESFSTGVVCIGTNFEANLLATVNLQKLGVQRVITKARTTTQHDILLKVGADKVVLPEHEAGVRLAHKLAAVNFIDFMELTEDTGVVEVLTPQRFIGNSLGKINLRQTHKLTVVAIRRGDKVVVSPGANEIIKENDLLVVLGRTDDCEKLEK